MSYHRPSLVVTLVLVWTSSTCTPESSRRRPTHDQSPREDVDAGAGGQDGQPSGGARGDAGRTDGPEGGSGDGGAGAAEAAPGARDAAFQEAARDVLATEARAGATPDTASDVPRDSAVLPPTFATVRRFLSAKCVGCHDPDHREQVDFKTSTGLYQRLLGRPTNSRIAACASQTLVVPRNLDASLLYQKILPDGNRRGCGVQMPKDCEDQDFCRVTPQETKALGDWILMGAPM